MTTLPNQSYTLEVQEDGESGDLFLQFSEEMLASLNWREGDTLQWHDNGDGSWTLTKVE